ncbi:DUF4974 domain-containing protein [Sphingobacterium alkalisoli]|uniref:DUF4974 domain-containing protein n=1 Tax=Sphingobacterium alkalisoli TaxID=1874115 RepID=A0A4U0GV25_9SPHI|nr:FecR domain-containing protein [Sphingobacterium alkalisoli]TJY62766.1 DUF4974 domain-containing protein [Sphingobacterium alkalisoli]GGH28753.1 hypothetical protein GCM10011418_39600 [Sphingobacterium alkalisoli]
MSIKYKELFKRYSQGKASKREVKIVDTYLEKLQNRNNTVDEAAAETGDRIYTRIQEALARRRRRYYELAAAVILFVAATAAVFQYSIKPVSATRIVISTDAGERKRVILPDSSLVILNAASRLTYTADFGSDARDVELEGEAYFEVSRDEEHPFVISSDDFTTEVLGTTFIINNYEGTLPAVTVLSGKVKVTDKKSSSTNVLTRSQRVVLDREKSSPVLEHVDRPEDYIAWIDGKVFFDRTPIGEVIETLERRFKVNMIVNSPLYSCDTISGRFTGDNITDILKSIQFINDMDYAIDTMGNVTISLKPCQKQTPM